MLGLVLVNKWNLVQKRVLDPSPQMLIKGKSRLRIGRDTREKLWPPSRRTITGKKNPASRLLLANPGKGRDQPREAEKLTGLICPWPFHQWGMDLLGPFDNSLGQLKFLIVAVDYFTKWIEAEPLSTVTSARIQRFFYKNVISCYGVPRILITDNGT